MVDDDNKKVKVYDLQHPQTVSSSIKIDEEPYALALLSDGLVAVTTHRKVIYLLVVNRTLLVFTRFATAIYYNGVAGHTNRNLIVSCRRVDNNGVSRIDIINCRGVVLRTITDSNRTIELNRPSNIFAGNNFVVVSDWEENAVFKVDIATGQLMDGPPLSHTDLLGPSGVTVDSHGNVVVCIPEGHCVLVCSPDRQWKRLDPPHDSHPMYDRPVAVCMTHSGRLVLSWNNRRSLDSIVIVYDL